MEDQNASVLNKTVSVLFAISLVFLIISFSICLPIYVRPFYYIQIEPLNIEEETGHTKEELKDAYNELMDYLTGDEEFGVGVFKYSESGKSHFYDCKLLFSLNTKAFAVSLSFCALVLLIYKIMKKRLWHPFGLNISFFAAVGTLLAFVVTGILVALDFESAFQIFHRIFFPGKTNWTFKVKEDPIILALPIGFFASCAVLILVSILSICITLIITALVKRRRSRNSAL